MVLDRLGETQFLKKEVESLEKEKNLLQQKIVQQTEIYTKFMESAAEKAIERVVDYSKRAIQSICTEDFSEKQIEGSQTLPTVSNSKDSAPATSKVNQDISSETKRMR